MLVKGATDGNRPRLVPTFESNHTSVSPTDRAQKKGIFVFCQKGPKDCSCKSNKGVGNFQNFWLNHSDMMLKFKRNTVGNIYPNIATNDWWIWHRVDSQIPAYDIIQVSEVRTLKSLLYNWENCSLYWQNCSQRIVIFISYSYSLYLWRSVWCQTFFISFGEMMMSTILLLWYPRCQQSDSAYV